VNRMVRVVKRVGPFVGLGLGTYSHHRGRVLPWALKPGAGPRESSPLPFGRDFTMPTMSITTPSFNQRAFLERTIESVVEQDYDGLEYTVQDGGSTDGSVDVIRQYENRLERWISEPDGGQAEAINRGFAGTTGQIMAWINSDDFYTPGTLKAVGHYFACHPDVDVVYGHRVIVDPDGCEVGRWILPPYKARGVRWRCYIPQETMFWRRSLWEQIGEGLDPAFQHALDWELMIRFVNAGARFVRLPRILGGFTTHPQQKSLAQRDSIGEAEFAKLRFRLSQSRSGWKDRIGSALYLLESIPWAWADRLGMLGLPK